MITKPRRKLYEALLSSDACRVIRVTPDRKLNDGLHNHNSVWNPVSIGSHYSHLACDASRNWLQDLEDFHLDNLGHRTGVTDPFVSMTFQEAAHVFREGTVVLSIGSVSVSYTNSRFAFDNAFYLNAINRHRNHSRRDPARTVNSSRTRTVIVLQEKRPAHHAQSYAPGVRYQVGLPVAGVAGPLLDSVTIGGVPLKDAKPFHILVAKELASTLSF